MEKLPISNEKEEKEKRLQAIKEKVEKITDKLGKPIDKGIRETVTLLQAFDLPASQSCGGHPERGDKAKSPWVEIYPKTAPDENGWWKNEELRKKVEEETNKLESATKNLLEEFYQNTNSPDDVKLRLRGIGYGFRLESTGFDNLSELPDRKRIEKIKEYKKEMEDFTQFLKDKYFQ